MNSTKKIPNKTVIRISNAIDFIERNLDNKLVLEEIAEKAYFSPYHFHRLFKAVTKETVNDFITRKRVEKSASFLLNKKNKTVTEVSEIVGFVTLSSFSRAFKKFYGMSPAEFKKESPSKYSKICKTESKNGKIETQFEQYICNINTNLKWMQMKAKTEVKKMPTLKVAYLTHQGKMDAVENAYHKLMEWAYPKGLMQQENLRMLTVYHDSPKITDEDKIRMSVCLTLNSEVKTEGEVSVKEIPELKCIVSRLEITPSEFQQAWESSFVWMSEHGFKKADQDPYEIFYNNPNEHPEGKCIVDICIPVD
ncbi:transcriptional regulator, AraC family [Tenacibaculum mesophilum]|uniref:AraC family transcriptional regulator n=1 Tax=Tenacibaculum mesophilum TaxID=104268 RepID=A0ABN5T4A3_9FLAO|nr:AraC family transcriptional regulator [Tenacibaculum mesophilum]AZJ31160.1 AraC family transcriptional regulator [Tenacibaculum mesophilum]QFS29207.1 helix-turn-helix domain-containing protein [Tenacibaculum mesophilum]SHF50764.1 transcriptional regulator, AraC family [Tenacibaculum mesophilum]